MSLCPQNKIRRSLARRCANGCRKTASGSRASRAGHSIIRYVTKDLTLKYDRKRIRLEVNDLTRGLVGKYVDVCEMPDGRTQVRAKGVALPCSIFDPHQQRVTHAAITENKHLSAVLVHIKEEQGKAARPPKVKPVSAKNGYRKSGRRPPGRPSKLEAYYERRRAERAKEASADYEFQGRKWT